MLQAHLDRAGLEELFGDNRITIQGEIMSLVMDKVKSLSAEYKLTHKVSEGKTIPKMGATSVSMVICGCIFSSPDDYNDHCSQIHGVTTRAHF